VPLANCSGWSVTTVESSSSSSHLPAVQRRLSAFHGTQCGYCTPGMVMAMTGLLDAKRGRVSGQAHSSLSSSSRKYIFPFIHLQVTLSNVENLLDGNICRCTGYRPILDAFKSFAADAPDELKNKVADIEDLADNGTCKGTCVLSPPVNRPLTLSQNWSQPTTLAQLKTTLTSLPREAKYKLVAGNTGTGVYKHEDGDATHLVSLSAVRELRVLTQPSSATANMVLGAAVTLSEAIASMESAASAYPRQFQHLTEMADHWKKVANTPVRNAGTLAGNLMIKHTHPDFPSDLAVTLQAAGALIFVASAEGQGGTVKQVEDFLRTDMRMKIVEKIEIPPLGDNEKFRSFKVTPRTQSSHAYVNAAFRAKVQNGEFASKPCLVYGNISSQKLRASATEDLLNGKPVNKATLSEAVTRLEAELQPEGGDDPLMPSAEYRMAIAKNLLYKFFLSCLGDRVDPKAISGSLPIQRGVSSGYQHFTTDPSKFPIGQPVKKLESIAQCAGEAKFVGDAPPIPSELHGAFVLAQVGNCDLDGDPDPSQALALPGVVAFFDYRNVPGQNRASTGSHLEEIFSAGRVHYAGQAVGLVVAETRSAAIEAARLVRIGYKNIRK